MELGYFNVDHFRSGCYYNDGNFASGSDLNDDTFKDRCYLMFISSRTVAASILSNHIFEDGGYLKDGNKEDCDFTDDQGVEA